MTTTVAIVEILVVGLFAALWMLSCIALLSDIRWDRIQSWAKDYKEWSAAATLAGTMAIYQLGWLVNGLSRAIMWPFAKRVRDRLHSKSRVDPEEVRATVYQLGSPVVLKDLDLDQSVIRLARAGIVNFLLISLLLLSADGQTATVAAVSLALVVGCILQWWHRNDRYYKRIIEVCEVVLGIEGNTARIFELSRTCAVFAKGVERLAIRIQDLHAIIACVGDIQPAVCINDHRIHPRQLASSLAVFPEGFEELSAAVEDEDAVCKIIGHIHAVCWPDRHPEGTSEIPPHESSFGQSRL